MRGSLPDSAGTGSLSETAGVPKECALGALGLKSFEMFDINSLETVAVFHLKFSIIVLYSSGATRLQ